MKPSFKKFDSVYDVKETTISSLDCIKQLIEIKNFGKNSDIPVEKRWYKVVCDSNMYVNMQNFFKKDSNILASFGDNIPDGYKIITQYVQNVGNINIVDGGRDCPIMIQDLTEY